LLGGWVNAIQISAIRWFASFIADEWLTAKRTATDTNGNRIPMSDQFQVSPWRTREPASARVRTMGKIANPTINRIVAFGRLNVTVTSVLVAFGVKVATVRR
jgi:hypothetical protein